MPTMNPTVDKLPSLYEVLNFLGEKRFQCIWFLPDKGRLCKVPIVSDGWLAAMESIRRIEFEATNACIEAAFPHLVNIAEEHCCMRHHKNKMGGLGLAIQLARRWQQELRLKLKIVQIEGQGVTKANDPTDVPITVSFTKHQLLEWQTVKNEIKSTIDTRACKIGSVYYYTHAGPEFTGMIKIGYTGRRTIQNRLSEWDECGHGSPQLLGSVSDVPHPKRVEALVHLELFQQRRQLKWCQVHCRSHIEWFKVALDKVDTITRQWCQWIREANPYDRRGHLKSEWEHHIRFLVEHDNPITAETMVLIHRIEGGSPEVDDFVDDTTLRRVRLECSD